jgi:CIC family chloride channel protein
MEFPARPSLESVVEFLRFLAGRLFPAAARSSVRALLADATDLDLPVVGRTLWHAALVGVAAGLMGTVFFEALEWTQDVLLVRMAGLNPLKASGEPATSATPGLFRPWLMVVLPALGALAGGLVTVLAPETRGGGTDETIDAFHHRGGMVRPRVIPVKVLAAVLTLGSGGAGGREGPTMQVGGAMGSLVGRLLGTSERHRRILLVAGMAAGISAVFRTPLGAALLAVEVLYHDGIESDALVPAVLASVISYSVAFSLLGSATLVAGMPSVAFVPSHLPLYVLEALVVSVVAALFVGVLRAVRQRSARLGLPAWARPALGGLGVGVVATVLVVFLGESLGTRAQAYGVLGGGYGLVQLAVSGSAWLPAGWAGVQVLLLLCLAKVVASSLTIGTGGSAGDFAPSLAMGAALGGALGRAAQLLLDDPTLSPAAFALVGMGAFYGGVAHVPLAALVLTCELAGSYELVVPLMVALSVSTVALRRVSLYRSQPRHLRDSPAHADPFAVLEQVTVQERILDRDLVRLPVAATAEEVLSAAGTNNWQSVFPVVDQVGRLVGTVSPATLRTLAAEPDAHAAVVAADLMQPAVSVSPRDPLRLVAELMLAHHVTQVPVRDDAGRVVGLVDEEEVLRAHREASDMAWRGVR